MSVINVEELNNAVIIYLSGEITMITVNEIDNVCRQYLNSDIDVLAFDMRNVQFIDSFGISRVIKQSKMFSSQNIEFVLVNLNDNIKQIFKIATFDKLFNIMSKDEFNIKYLIKSR
jgi:anti-anti-sigma factor